MSFVNAGQEHMFRVANDYVELRMGSQLEGKDELRSYILSSTKDQPPSYKVGKIAFKLSEKIVRMVIDNKTAEEIVTMIELYEI